MNKINFENLPSKKTPLNAEILNTMQSNIEESCVAVSPTQPETNEKVWIDNENNVIKTKNDDGTFKTIYDKSEIIELQARPNPADYGIGGQCKNVSGDWNTACGNGTGFYMGHELSNAPLSGWIYVIHMVHNENYAKQIALSFFSTDMWIRQKNNGEWSGWSKLH